MADQELIGAFANKVLGDWGAAMDGFFYAVDRKRQRDHLSDNDVRIALAHGYGDEIGDAWTEWPREN